MGSAPGTPIHLAVPANAVRLSADVEFEILFNTGDDTNIRMSLFLEPVADSSMCVIPQAMQISNKSDGSTDAIYAHFPSKPKRVSRKRGRRMDI